MIVNILCIILIFLSVVGWCIGVQVFITRGHTVYDIIEKEIKGGKPWERCFLVYMLLPVLLLWSIKSLVLKTRFGKWFFLGE